MSSGESSSSNSSSSEGERKRKSKKKHKNKSEKKHKKHKKEKRHKQKKRSKDDVGSTTAKIYEVSKAPVRSAEETVENSNAFGPALPPHLIKVTQQPKEKTQPIIGPIMPVDFASRIATVDEDTNDNEELGAKSIENVDDDNEDDIAYGPIPVNTTENAQLTETQIELEQRALQLKLAALEGTTSQTVDQKVREEWMLELPEVGLKTGLAALTNMKRTFHQGKERPDFSDRSSWTKTPQGDETAASTSKSTSADIESNAKALYERQRDEEQERIAKKHRKKHKRDESLVEIHQKKLRKEEKRKLKELAAVGAKPERRPFSRDVDLKLDKIDKNQTKQIVDKAKILNTKFASGRTKYL